jgi:hypothetical protein
MDRRLLCMLLSCVALACNARTASDGGSEASSETGETGDDDEHSIELARVEHRNLDILFVIDDSASMGEAQARLVESLRWVLEPMGDEAKRGWNFKVAFTTTDNGNPRCAANTTTPTHGEFVLSSCSTRLGEFVLDGNDVSARACTDHCTLHGAAQLEILPTTTALDPVAKPRRWLERIEGVANFDAVTSLGDAFACAAPQGIAGCEFESPLESMYQALLGSSTPGHPNFGFLRESAILMIVFVTDEVDCSHQTDEIFSADGNKTFWSDPDAAAPTSAVCWNAGVACSGDPSHYDSCDPAEKDILGNLANADAEAALYPLSRYLELVQQIENAQQALIPEREVIVTLISGVAADGTAHYGVSDDPLLQAEYGIGWGCTGPNPNDPERPLVALPPVRLREFTDAFSTGNMFSLCEADYGPALESLFESTLLPDPPSCFPRCVADTDSTAELVQPECEVIQEVPGEPDLIVSECARAPDGSYLVESYDYVMPSPDADACFALLSDANQVTPSSADDMSPECTDASLNLEFKLARRPTGWVRSGTIVTATCTTAPESECI